MFITNNEYLQVSIPICIFNINKLCEIFDEVTILSQDNEIVECTVKLSISSVEQILNHLISTPFLHPFLNESIAYRAKAGPVTANMDVSFLIYESAHSNPTPSGENDAFIKYSDFFSVPTYISLPVYMPLFYLKKNCQLLDHYSLKFDKVLLIGHTAGKEFINHAIVCCPKI